MPHILQRIIAIFLIFFFAPLIALICIITWISIRKFPIFRQERVGKNGAKFIMHKIKTVKADSKFPIWPTAESPVRFWFGKFLRRFWLDEIAQLYDIVRGEMNLVGPRPEMTIFSRYFDVLIEQYHIRRSVYPGITGLAQVNGYRNNTDLDERIRLDVEYIRKRSFYLDIKIILLTILEVLTSKNYRSRKRNRIGFAEELTRKVMEFNNLT